MNIDDCYCLGRITKTWGVKGQLVLFLDVDTPEDYAELDSAFVEIKGQLVPHFFQIDSFNGNKAIATFEDCTPDQAQSLVGHELYLPLELLPKLDGNRFYFHEVIGYHMVDSVYGSIGTLQQVLDNPAQPLFQIDNGGVEILVPVIDQVIDRVDRDNKTIFITAPEGLIDLYMGGSK